MQSKLMTLGSVAATLLVAVSTHSPSRANSAPRGDSAKPAAPVTYSNQIVRIFQNRCQACHRPGEAAPFSLLGYDDAKHWADTIKEVTQQRRMPPWFADPSCGKFSNDRSLTKDEIDTIAAWVDAGTPKGDDNDLPPPKQFVDGWQIGTPDVVLTMPKEVSVQATGVMGYRYASIPTNFEEDKWVQAVELRAGNHAVVHHILMNVRAPRADRQARGPGLRDRLNDADEQALGFFAALAPGNIPDVYPSGQGKLIPKGSTIIFQMHYTPNGTATTDRSSVGLIFAKEPVRTEMHTRGIFNNFFSIPPGDDHYKVNSGFVVKQDEIVVTGLMPHMHLRGKDFEYEVEYPDGRKEMLLSVPKYNFNWQLTYNLAEPLRLPKGSKIRCLAHFDNSPANKANPDPTKRVGWGDQTYDEMMIGYIKYYVTGDRDAANGDASN